MPYRLIQTPSDGRRLQSALADAEYLAVDCEAAGYHRYSDRLCLVQVTTPGETFLVDPLSFDPSDLLREALEDPARRVYLHGADFDLRLLQRDLGLKVRGLFDTQVAAALLGEPALGLGALLERYLGVTLSKKHQRADWARRPLPTELLEYAAADTRYLPELGRLLERELRDRGRLAWAEEEFRRLESVAGAMGEESPIDPVSRIKGARDLKPRELEALRVALEWRDRIARSRDRAPFRVIGDAALLEIAVRRPTSLRDLEAIPGFPKGLLRAEGRLLLSGIRAAEALPEKELEPFPTPRRSGPGRPPPEVEELAEALKAVRNRRADEFGLARGTLLSNAVIVQIAAAAPHSRDELAGVEGIRRWQVDVLGEEILAAVAAWRRGRR